MTLQLLGYSFRIVEKCAHLVVLARPIFFVPHN